MNNTFAIAFNPNYMTVFEFEKQHDYEGWFMWLDKNPFFAVYASTIYLGAIHFGQKFMSEREKSRYNLRRWLTAWNCLLAVMSMTMFVRMLPEVVEEARNYGVYSTFCHFKQHNIATRFWALLFTFSKILEFGDTFFLVMAKKPILFLHWWHHITVVSYSFTIANWSDPLGRWFALINLFAHSIMYSYYGLRSMGANVPKAVSMCITLIQISQMIFGVVVNIQTCSFREGEYACNRPYWACKLGLMMYASYLVLFANFFYHAYLKSSCVRRKIKAA